MPLKGKKERVIYANLLIFFMKGTLLLWGLEKKKGGRGQKGGEGGKVGGAHIRRILLF